MTAANRLIASGFALSEVFDPGSVGFRQIPAANSLGAAVLSVLTSRPIFWTTQSLVFGYALDVEDGAFAEDGPEFRELFRADRFGSYVGESGFDPRDDKLLDSATVLDSLLSVEMRQAAMLVNVAVNQCVLGCRGNSDCVRRCLARGW